MIHLSSLIITFGLLLWPNTLSNAHPLVRRVEDIDIQVTSKDNFCSYLPPTAGETIAKAEGNAVPFCTQQQEPGTRTFPEGFIVSSHFDEKPGYVQNEHGGTCNGYKYWVNLVEPAQKTFCIRCCESADDCNTGISSKGCESIIKDGDYS
ncbi:hypothetical protein K492DRAFT_184170 [Lichtheimia hyalospora FSU 10163]|nr:hypothetical protein K492DRAFT_184170 [Lichtheimia hyalospora FSU 10163]